jgi:hypothetical protein
MILTVVVAAAVAVSFAWASPSSRSERGVKALPVAQLVELAHGSARSLGAPGVETALVVATRKNQAENWMEPGAVPSTSANPMVWVVVIQGRFVCNECSSIAGTDVPHGRSAQSIWLPGRGVSDFGLTRRLPPGLSKLGHVIKLRLTPPRISARDVALDPGTGIGPVAIGGSVRELTQKLGPVIEPGEYVLGPMVIFVQHGQQDRVVRFGVSSPDVTIDGAPLGDGFSRLKGLLQGWHAVTCQNGVNTLRHDTGTTSTVIEFAGDRFNLAVVGELSPGRCTPPFPANP